jgi:hypothetical protein
MTKRPRAFRIQPPLNRGVVRPPALVDLNGASRRHAGAAVLDTTSVTQALETRPPGLPRIPWLRDSGTHRPLPKPRKTEKSDTTSVETPQDGRYPLGSRWSACTSTTSCAEEICTVRDAPLLTPRCSSRAATSLVTIPDENRSPCRTGTHRREMEWIASKRTASTSSPRSPPATGW